MKKDNRPKEKIGSKILNIVTFSWWKYRRGYWAYLILAGLVVLYGYMTSK